MKAGVDIRKNGALCLLILLLLLCCSSCSTYKSDVVVKNREQFEGRIAQAVTEYRLVELNELTPFEWDKAYFFGSYVSADDINKKIGEKWLDIPDLTYREDAMAIVFMHREKAVCCVFGASSDYYLSSSMEEVYAKDHPKFLVKTIAGSGIIKGPVLEWFDEGRMGGEALHEVSDDMAGRWEYKDSTCNIAFTLTKEGAAMGLINYTIVDAADAELTIGGGSIRFMGRFDGEALHCSVYDSNIMKKSNMPAAALDMPAFDMAYAGGRFELDTAFEVPLLDGGEMLLEGQWEFVRFGDIAGVDVDGN